MSKLDDLCAIKVMGWELVAPDEPNSNQLVYVTGEDTLNLEQFHKGWNPSTSLDDALVCLERAAVKRRWEIMSYEKFDNDKQTYFYVRLVNHTSGPKIKRTKANHESLPVAMCLCSLRAMGVPESEIQEAMK